MNLSEMIADGFRRAPEDARVAITFTDKDGNTVTGEAVGVPASANGDGFQEGLTIRERNRRLSVLLPADSAPIRAGMTTEFEGAKWNVLGPTPLAPNGSATGLWRVTLAR